MSEVSRDRRRLQAAAALRATGTSLGGVLLGIYLAEIGFDATGIGAVSAAGLCGAAAAALLVTWRGDAWGRRRSLIALSVLGLVAGMAFLAARSLWALSALAFLGMLNAMGRDRGAAAILEQAALPATVPASRRTLAFAWYTALQDAGHALGSLLAGLAGVMALLTGWSAAGGMRATLALGLAFLLATVPLYLRLSPSIEAPPAPSRPRLSPASRRVVARICALFALDGIGGGFLVSSLLAPR